MMLWNFLQYVTGWNEWPFRDWHNRQDPHIRARFDAVRLVLRNSESWRSPRTKLFKGLEEDHMPLSEIRFRADDTDPRTGRVLKKRRIRVFGFYDEQVRLFAIYGAGEEDRDGRYIPAGADDDALTRYRNHINGSGELHEID